MARKSSGFTITDQFCGAGGSSIGASKVAKRIKGVEIKLAMNHWKLAIETHNTNFPHATHVCADISSSSPRRYPSTDLLITSPSCTNHSLSNGKKKPSKQFDMFETYSDGPDAERSRATMWDVPRFAEYHGYNIIIVENVVDVRKWVMWDSWLMAMHSLGYLHKCVYANSMHFFPTPQSRDRIYIVFWKKGNRKPNLEHTPVAHCYKCGKNVNALQVWKKPDAKFGKYKKQYTFACPICTTQVEPYYYAAFNCIDWSDKGKRVGDNPNISPNTLRRMEVGLQKYGHPFIWNDQQSTGIDFRVRSTSETVFTVPGRHDIKIGMPFVIKGEHTKANDNSFVSAVTDVVGTQCTRQTMGVLVPWIVELNRTGECMPATEPTSTFTSGAINHAMLQTPFLVDSAYDASNSKIRSITDANFTQTTHNKTGIVTNEAFNAFINYYYSGSDQTSHITESIDAVTSKDRAQLITYKQPRLEDCYYRTLKPHEVQLAMAFDKEYIVLGNSKEKVKQLGNAVTPPVMEWLVERCIESLN